MGSEANIHRRVLGEDHIAAAREDVGIDRPTRSVEGKSGGDGRRVGGESDEAAQETEARAAPDCAPHAARGVSGSGGPFLHDPVVGVEVHRRHGQQNINRGQKVVGFGLDGMRTALRVEFDMRIARDVHTLEAGFNLAR